LRFIRLLILTPTALPTVSGNAMTAERWRRSLVGMGLDVRVLATEGLAAGDLKEEIRRFGPDLIHIHNAYRAGGLLLHSCLAGPWTTIPLVVSPSGTDMNIESNRETGKEVVGAVLGRADAIIVQSEEGRERLGEVFPGRMDRVRFVPKSFVWLGEESSDLRSVVGAGPDDILFFMPAGIRPVKGNLECLLGFEKIRGLRSRARIVFAGPSLDDDYAERFRSEVQRQKAFACWIPPIPPAAMRSAYGSAEVVLNGSFSEGLSNVLLEGKAAGKPLLASDIPSNRWPILGGTGDPPMGLLFNPQDPDDFVRKALALIDDDALRQRLGQAAAAYASRMPGPCDEARALVAVYEAAMNRES
jgi:glycosyltransferase involved in cell wall biosynthesis